MKKYTKADAVDIVSKAAKEYQKELVGRKLLFLLMDKHMRITTLEVSFEKQYFQHLTGLKVTNGLDATRFFERCVKLKLGQDDFEFSEDGTTPLKLEVLPKIIRSDLAANMVADYNGCNLKLYTEKLVGSVKACIGFTKVGESRYVPNTLLNVDIRQMSNSQFQVIATYRKRRNEEIYTEQVHKSKSKRIDWTKLKYPEEYAYLQDTVLSKERDKTTNGEDDKITTQDVQNSNKLD